MVGQYDDTAVNKEDIQSSQDKNMRQDKFTNTTRVTYEGRDGTRYSTTNVLTFGGDQEPNPDGAKFDAVSPLPL